MNQIKIHFLSIALIAFAFCTDLYSQQKQNTTSLSLEFWNQIKNDDNLETKVEYTKNLTHQLSEIFAYLNVSLSKQDSLFETFETFAQDIANISPQTSIDIGERLLMLARANNDSSQIAGAHVLLAVSLKDLGNYQLALKYLHELLPTISDTIRLKYLASILNAMGSIYVDIGEYQSSIEFFEQLIKLSEKQQDEKLLLTAYLNISGPHLSLGEVDKAIYYVEKALLKAKTIGERVTEAYAQGNLAYFYLSKGQVRKAIEYQNKGLAIEVELNDKLAMIDSNGVLAMCYAALGDKEKMEYHMNKSLVIALELEAMEKLMDVYQSSAQAYEGFGDFKKAYENSKLFHELYDSLLNMDRNDQVAEMREKYETEKKETEIINLQKDNQLASLEIDKEKNQKTILTIVSVLFMVIAASAFLFYYQTKKSKKELEKRNGLISGINKKLNQSQDALLESNKTKDKFFALIAHDLRGPITSFQGIGRMLQFSLKKNKTEKAEALIESIDESANGINILLDNLLKWSLSQTGSLPFKAEAINLKTIVDDTITIYKQSCKAKNIDLINNVNDDCMVNADHNTVSTVLRNLLGNAFKFTHEHGTISVESVLINDNYELTVSDTGMGIEQGKLLKIFEFDGNKTTKGTKGEKGTGLGLMLCKEFIIKNSGDIWIDSQEGKGTKITFSLPSLISQRVAETSSSA